MKILVRLPNWLGDMVVSIGFIQALREAYPHATISVIVKTGLEDLLDYFPPLQYRYLFSKEEYSGFNGAMRFGRHLAKEETFDLYFSLPDSFSAAAMGFASGAKKRIGYRNEGRAVFLTHAPSKDKSLHRVDQYIHLLDHFTGRESIKQTIRLSGVRHIGGETILVNVNSEADSRRLPLDKAISLVSGLRLLTDSKLVMIGGKNDLSFVEQVVNALPVQNNIEVIAGKTNLPELIEKMSSARLLLTTDSGPAHLANACGLPTIVLFGAGNENNTAPYNKDNCEVIRLGELPCEPCVKNVCELYGIPKCLQLLDEQRIMRSVSQVSAVH